MSDYREEEAPRARVHLAKRQMLLDQLYLAHEEES